jgi:Zn-dependent protease with chaperone function
LIRFPDGAFCEVTEVASLGRLLAHGHHEGRVAQWEGSLKWIVVSGVALLALLVVGYRYGVPVLAAVAAEYVPERLVKVTSDETLKLLDGVFAPTGLDQARRMRLIDRFKRLRWPDGDGRRQYEILFRKSDALGPNALALPSGTLIVTDALVELATNDDQIVAVLAHEAGHVEHHHGLRLVFQNSVVALIVTWLVGDVSTLLAAAPTALLQAKYSRDFERDADAYAVSVLRVNDIGTEPLATLLERVDAAVDKMHKDPGVAMLDYLSSHPVTAERLEALRGH